MHIYVDIHNLDGCLLVTSCFCLFFFEQLSGLVVESPPWVEKVVGFIPGGPKPNAFKLVLFARLLHTFDTWQVS